MRQALAPGATVMAFSAWSSTQINALPVATPPNAIVYGSGYVPLRSMLVAGAWLDLNQRKLIAPPMELLAAMRTLPRTEDYQDLPSSLK